MHHLNLGLFYYQIEYTKQLIKDQHGNSFVNEIDHRLATILRFSRLKIFSNGIQLIARLTVSEYHDLMKVILFVVDNLYNQNTNNTEDYVENKYLASLYQNWNEMYIISKYEKFTESDLIKFQVCIIYIIIFILLYKKNSMYLMLYNLNFYFIFFKQKQIISNRFDANQLLNSLKISHQQKLLLYF